MIELLLSKQQTQARDAALHHLETEQALERLWQRDPSLWYPAPETQARIQQQLGWVDLPSLEEIEAVYAVLQASIQQRSPEQIVYVVPGVLGRAVQLWQSLVEQPRCAPQIVVLDSADPRRVEEVLASQSRKRTLVVHAGAFDTPPTMLLAQVLPPDVAVPLPRAVGERFGALTGAALAPALLQGLDLPSILDLVQATLRSSGSTTDNRYFQLGATLGTLAQEGRDVLYVLAPPDLMPLARWIQALVAGALSKHHRGFVPLITSSVHSVHDNGIVVQLAHQQPDPATNKMIGELHRAGVPVVRCAINTPDDFAAQVWLWQLSVAVTAMVIGVNPFDAPDADVINARIKQRLDASNHPDLVTEDDLQALLEHAAFLAIAAYLPHDYDAELETVRSALAEHFDLPALLVYPLRDAAFSLQLLHAGRPGGVVLVLSSESDRVEDSRVAPLDAVKRVHCAVERETWQRMQRPYAHVDLGDDVAVGLARLKNDLLAE